MILANPIVDFLSFETKYAGYLAIPSCYSMTGIGGRPEVIIMGSDTLEPNATWKVRYFFICCPV